MMSESFFPSPIANLTTRPLVDNFSGAISEAAVPVLDPLNPGIKASSMHGSLCALRRLLQGADKVLREWTHEVGPSGYAAAEYHGLGVAPGTTTPGSCVTCIAADTQPHQQRQEEHYQQQKESSSGGAASPEARSQPHTASTPAGSVCLSKASEGVCPGTTFFSPASDAFEISTKALRTATQPDVLPQLLERLPVLVQTLFDISGNPPSASNSTGPLDAASDCGNASMADLLRQLASSLDGVLICSESTSAVESVDSSTPQAAHVWTSLEQGTGPQVLPLHCRTLRSDTDTSEHGSPTVLLSSLVSSIVIIATAALRTKSLAHTEQQGPHTTSAHLKHKPTALSSDQLLAEQQELHTALLSSHLAHQACLHDQEIERLCGSHQKQMIGAIFKAKQDIVAARALAQISAAQTRSSLRLCESILIPSNFAPTSPATPHAATDPYPPSRTLVTRLHDALSDPLTGTYTPSTHLSSQALPASRQDMLSHLPSLLHRCSIALRQQRATPGSATVQPSPPSLLHETAPPTEPVVTGTEPQNSRSSSVDFEIVPLDVQAESPTSKQGRAAFFLKAFAKSYGFLQATMQTQDATWDVLKRAMLSAKVLAEANAIEAREKICEQQQQLAELRRDLEAQKGESERQRDVETELRMSNKELEALCMATMQSSLASMGFEDEDLDTSTSSNPQHDPSHRQLQQRQPLVTSLDVWQLPDSHPGHAVGPQQGSLVLHHEGVSSEEIDDRLRASAAFREEVELAAAQQEREDKLEAANHASWLEVSRLKLELHRQSRKNEELTREVARYQEGVWVCDQMVGQAVVV